jgi:hypothetical protein
MLSHSEISRQPWAAFTALRAQRNMFDSKVP